MNESFTRGCGLMLSASDRGVGLREYPARVPLSAACSCENTDNNDGFSHVCNTTRAVLLHRKVFSVATNGP